MKIFYFFIFQKSKYEYVQYFTHRNNSVTIFAREKIILEEMLNNVQVILLAICFVLKTNYISHFVLFFRTCGNLPTTFISILFRFIFGKVFHI